MTQRILGEQNAQSLDEILEQVAGLCSEGVMHSYQGVLIRQVLPVAHPHHAQLPFAATVAHEVAEVLQAYGDRTRIFFRIESRSGQLCIVLGADMLYNTYGEYLSCLQSLAPRLEDALFFMGYDGEDDEGETYYVIDRCEISAGELLVERRVSGPSEDFDISLRQLYANAPSRS